MYYLLLASGRFASYRPSINAEDMLSVPIPNPQEVLLEGITDYEAIDTMVQKAFRFKESEWTLVEDLFEYVLPDFKEGAASPGRCPTRQKDQAQEDKVLVSYCTTFLKVLQAGFGADVRVSAAIFRDPEAFLPVTMCAVHFATPHRDGVRN